MNKHCTESVQEQYWSNSVCSETSKELLLVAGGTLVKNDDKEVVGSIAKE